MIWFHLEAKNNCRHPPNPGFKMHLFLKFDKFAVAPVCTDAPTFIISLSNKLCVFINMQILKFTCFHAPPSTAP